MEQYPDSIVITIKPDPTQDPVTKAFSSPTGADTIYSFGCRAEKNSTGAKAIGRDGAVRVFTFTCFMPRTLAYIPPDADYVLTKGEQVFAGKIIDSANGQLNSRLWL